MSTTTQPTTVLCVEYGQVTPQNGLADALVADQNMTVVFPHVDSCLAIIYLMPSGRAICGHASANLGKNLDRKMMLDDMTTRMTELDEDNKKPDRMIFVGDAGWEDEVKKFVQQETKKVLNSNDTYFNTGDALDIFLKLGPRKINVCKSTWSSLVPNIPTEGTSVKEFTFT